MSETNRRDFITASSVAASAALVTAAGGVYAQGPDEIKVGLVGCGGRGSGAIRDCLSADKSVRVYAIGDVFLDRAERQANSLNEQYKERTSITGRTFGGVDAYKAVIDSGVDLVLLATPPGFRPKHLEYAVQKGKHVFCEKPVAVDGPGIRKCMELVEESKKKNLAIVAGTQRRHQKAYLEVAKRIKNGDIGEIVGGRCAWNNNGIWFNARKEGESDIEYQMRNWYHFLWVCGDHIVEQHVHNLDVINWFTGQHPIRCVGQGGRMGGTSARPNGEPNAVGHIFDHFAVEYEYPNGVKIASYCRHYPGKQDVSEMVVGTKGTIKTSSGGYYTLNGKEIYSADDDSKKDRSPYQLEHVDLIASIKNGKPLNELQAVTESTMTAIMGRMSTYTGQELTWKQAMESKEDTFPKDFQLKGKNPIGPVPVPGKTKFI